MATVNKCDRCGKIYEKDEYSNIKIVEERTSGTLLNRYDLCPDCVDRFHEFLSDKQTSEKENNQTADRRVGDAFYDIHGLETEIFWNDNVATQQRTVYCKKILSSREKEEIIRKMTNDNDGCPYEIVFENC